MTTTQPMGEIIDGDPPVLRFVRHLGHRPEKVWRALTESEHLRAWLPCDMVGDRAEGAPIELPFWPEVAAKYDMGDDPTPTGTIEQWDPPRRFQWTWGGDIVRFELEPDGEGTTLTLTTWVHEIPPTGVTSVAAGYHVCLDHLGQLLDTGSAPSVAADDPTPLEERYAARLAGQP
ncbi:MAG TPA: SRPBCC domain-containing protein [Acidimicrobiales bacterium]|nr:SRPBCC domain-containing protein [Acidimicrobiales bacterium]